MVLSVIRPTLPHTDSPSQVFVRHFFTDLHMFHIFGAPLFLWGHPLIQPLAWKLVKHWSLYALLHSEEMWRELLKQRVGGFQMFTCYLWVTKNYSVVEPNGCFKHMNVKLDHKTPSMRENNKSLKSTPNEGVATLQNSKNLFLRSYRWKRNENCLFVDIFLVGCTFRCAPFPHSGCTA